MKIIGSRPYDLISTHGGWLSSIKVLSCLVPFLVSTACAWTPESSRQSEQSSSVDSTGAVVALSSNKSRDISSGFICFNVNAVRVKSWENPAFLSAVRDLSPSVLRLPGGDVGNFWDWRRGGLVQNVVNLPDGYPKFLKSRERQYEASKLGNIKHGLDRTETSPLFVLNMLSSNLASQLAMLKQAEQLGIPIRELELGNEFYFATKNNRAVFPGPEDYARVASEWLRTLKSEYPDAKISVVGVDNQGLEGHKKFQPRRRNWNQTVLPLTLQQADAATFHIYPRHGLPPLNNVTEQSFPLFDETDVEVILGEPFRHWHKLQQSNEFQFVPRNKEIWITEYNLSEKISGDRSRPPRVIGSWTHGLYTLALSLLFLEDARVQKICNHVLVGSSQFAAVYANQKSFVNPTTPTASAPNSLSATGHSMQLFSKAINGATSAQQMQFQILPTLTGKDQFQYPSLYGWTFQVDNRQKRSILMNLSSSAQKVDVSQIFQNPVKFEQIHSAPRTLVTDASKVSRQLGTAVDRVLLPPLSVTLLLD